jgi:ABC-type multidrug transport system fused ATPase/permease subunit
MIKSSNSSISLLLEDLGFDTNKAKQVLSKLFEKRTKKTDHPEGINPKKYESEEYSKVLSIIDEPDSKKIFEHAVAKLTASNYEILGTEQIISSILEDKESDLTKILEQFGITEEIFEEKLSHINSRQAEYEGRQIVFTPNAFIAMSLSTALDLISPLVTRKLVNEVIISHHMENLMNILITFIWMALGRCVFQYTKEFLCDWAGSKIACEIRSKIFRKLQSLSANFFDKHNSGELMARVRDDVDRIWDCFTYISILIAEVVIRTVIALYCMFAINWKLSIIPALCMIGASVIAIRMEKKLDIVFGQIANI